MWTVKSVCYCVLKKRVGTKAHPDQWLKDHIFTKGPVHSDTRSHTHTHILIFPQNLCEGYLSHVCMCTHVGVSVIFINQTWLTWPFKQDVWQRITVPKCNHSLTHPTHSGFPPSHTHTLHNQGHRHSTANRQTDVGWQTVVRLIFVQ